MHPIYAVGGLTGLVTLHKDKRERFGSTLFIPRELHRTRSRVAELPLSHRVPHLSPGSVQVDVIVRLVRSPLDVLGLLLFALLGEMTEALEDGMVNMSARGDVPGTSHVQGKAGIRPPLSRHVLPSLDDG